MRAAFGVVILLLTAVLLFSMTAAWFTNVSDTGGLVFVTSQWGFDGRIVIEGDVIDMAPGESGLISMQITNDGEVTATAGVTVSKAKLNDLMKKRLYFYVDTVNYRNSERMDRVYVSSSGGYTYTVFPGSGIYVTADMQNAPVLKWEWVYDVLGYYVYGRITDDSVQIDEYIRPIKYEYDPITTTFTADGYLKTTDGYQTAGEFLTKLSETDGYAGTIDLTRKTANGYYPVYVNSEGYGVWAYLCTYSEILQNTQDDTEIGTSDDTRLHSVEVSVVGSQTTETAVNVGDKETLTSLLETTGNASLKLTEDITLDESIVIESGYRADIDLNGYTITSSAENVFSAGEGSKITLMNGELVGNGQSACVNSSGAEVVLNNVTLTEFKDAVRVNDHQNGFATDSRVHIMDSEITGSNTGLWIYGNNGDTDTMTTVIVERSTITGDGYAGIISNGSYPGIAIQVIDSIVTGYYTSIYHPQKDSTLLVDNSTLEGITGIVIKGGFVTINNSTIRGTGTAEQISPPGESLSGFMDTGDGIYLEANYDRDTQIIVKGGKTVVTSDNALAVRKHPIEDADSAIYIQGGTFNTDVSDYLDGGVSQFETEDGLFVIISAE